MLLSLLLVAATQSPAFIFGPSDAPTQNVGAQAANGWEGVYWVSTNFYDPYISPIDEPNAEYLMFHYAVLPKIHDDELAPRPWHFDIGVPIIDVPDLNTNPAYQARAQFFRDLIEIGDQLMFIRWYHESVGLFSSYGVMRNGEWLYDSMISEMPRFLPDTQNGQGSPWGTGITWRGTSMFGGVQYVITAKINKQCNPDGTVSTCTSDPDAQSGTMWEAEAVQSCYSVSNPATGDANTCCYCEVTMGVAGGLKSVSAAAGGLSFSGSLGFSRKRTSSIGECCR